MLGELTRGTHNDGVAGVSCAELYRNKFGE